jgi:hypothetical protein
MLGQPAKKAHCVQSSEQEIAPWLRWPKTGAKPRFTGLMEAVCSEILGGHVSTQNRETVVYSPEDYQRVWWAE